MIHQINTIKRDQNCVAPQYFVRHGECQSNVRWPIPNYLDSNDTLTSRGRGQACRAALTIQHFNEEHNSKYMPAAVFCSTLTRARETCAIICECIGAPTSVIYDDRLREYGGKDEGYPNFISRVSAFLEEADRSTHPMIVVTHGHTMQAVLTLKTGALDGSHVRTLVSAEIRNGGVSVFRQQTLLHWNVAVGHGEGGTGRS